MAPHSSSDKSLLDRLNALKPTAVNLDRSTNLRLTLDGCCLADPKSALSIPAAAEEPLSREDALTERLRSLRNQREQRDHHVDSPDISGRDPPPPYTASASASPSATRAQPPPPQPSSAARATGLSTPGVTAGNGRRSAGGGGDKAAAAEGGSQSSGDEYDHYFDDVLQPLDLDEDGSDSDGGRGGGAGEEGEGSSKRVEDLLAKLKADPGAAAQPPLPAGVSKPDTSSSTNKAKDESDDESDDSDGEVMSHEVENVISRAMDELKLDGPRGGEPEAGGDGRRAAGPGGDDDAGLALPTVPQDAAETKEHDQQPQGSNNGGGGDGEAGLSLPAVPTALVDPAPTSGAIVPDGSSGGSSTDPFESSIEARLAALKGASAPIIHTDELGLPSAPTFRPEDNRPPPPPRRLGRGGGGSRAGYTDADQRTWCIVCLEDGTIRCLGCAEDGSGVGEVYCARCWKEMHVGPAAGYDERGHAWEKFDPRRV